MSPSLPSPQGGGRGDNFLIGKFFVYKCNVYISKIPHFLSNKDKMVVTLTGASIPSPRKQTTLGFERSTSRSRNGRPATELF